MDASYWIASNAPTVIEAEKPDEHSHSLNDYMATSDSSDVVKKLENVGNWKM